MVDPVTPTPMWVVVLYPLVTAVVGFIVSYTEVMRRKDKEQAEKDRLEDMRISQAIIESNKTVVQSNLQTQRTVLKANEQVTIVGQGVETLKTHFNIPAPDVPKPPTEEELALEKIQTFIQQFKDQKVVRTQHATVNKPIEAPKV